MKLVTSFFGLIVLGASLSTLAEQGAQPEAPRRVDLKVAFWYRRDRPIETFQYQAASYWKDGARILQR